MAARSAVLAVSVAGAGAAPAQSVEDLVRDVFRAEVGTGAVTNGFQALSIVGGAPGISAASFSVDDDDFAFDVYKISPSHAFEVGWSGVRPYAEISLGYLDADQDFTFRFPSGGTDLDLDIHVLTALAGAGVEFDIAPGTVVRPIALFGYSRITDDAELVGPEAELLAAAGEGLLFDVEIDSLLYGAALAVETDQTIGEDIALNASLRYSHLVDDVIDASEPELEGTNDFGTLTAGVELDGPIGLSVFGRELRWIGFASHTYLPGEKDALGFSYFFELGGGVEIVDRDVLSFIEGVSLRGSGIVGNGVTGFTAGATIEF
ncbi:MAG: hypothetical protein ACFBWO_18790 [Paracoccaceae bacterium]